MKPLLAPTLMLMLLTPALAQTDRPLAKFTAPAASQRSRARIAPAPAQTQAAAAPLSPAELAIAAQVHLGRMACELGAFVTVSADLAAAGYFHVEGQGFKYRMTPVPTSTGAVRLEDPKGGAVWLQIANKSMLMSQRLGRRLADECRGAEQMAVSEAFKHQPPASVLDPPPPPDPPE